MTRMLLPLSIADLSSFAKKLKIQLDDRASEGLSTPPSHLELLNLLARASGMRNFQTFRASVADAPAIASPTQSAPLVPEVASEAIDLGKLSPTVRKTLMQFDTAGRLVRLPNKLSVQQMAMWWMWTQFAVRRKYTEKEVNQVLNAHHTFGDQATLRRELVNMKLLGRKSDCSEYWKEPMRPSEEVQDFLRALRQAVAGAQPTKALTALSSRQAHPTRRYSPTVN
ncbi:MAG: DUF2087 domain-containing protein [Pseudomonadota bacterium]